MTIEIGGLAKEYSRIVSPTFIYGFLFFLVRRPPSYRPRGFWSPPPLAIYENMVFIKYVFMNGEKDFLLCYVKA